MSDLITQLSDADSAVLDNVEQGAPGVTSGETVNSRFGPITIFREKAVHFASGLLGMPDKKEFCIARFPYPSPLLLSYNIEFFILQSLSETSLSFIVAPVDISSAAGNGQPIARHLPQYQAVHLDECFADTPYSREEAVLLCITTVHHNATTGEKFFTVNAKAPLLIDALAKQGIQHVFAHEAYAVQHPLS